jgi:hypothetical protein
MLKILVEGLADQKFINDYYFHLTGNRMNSDNFIHGGGYGSKFIENTLPLITQAKHLDIRFVL